MFVGRPERKLWWRNFRGGAPVTVRIGAERLEGFGEVVTEPGAVAATLRSYLAKFPRAARTAGALERAVMVQIRIEAPAERSLESIAPERMASMAITRRTRIVMAAAALGVLVVAGALPWRWWSQPPTGFLERYSGALERLARVREGPRVQPS